MRAFSNRKMQTHTFSDRKALIIANVWLLMANDTKREERENDGVCHLQSDDGSYFDWNDKRLRGSVWNKWRREKARSKRPNESF